MQFSSQNILQAPQFWGIMKEQINSSQEFTIVPAT